MVDAGNVTRRDVTIGTVLFDADGVLQYPGDVHAHFRERHGWPETKVDAFFGELFQQWLPREELLTGGCDPRTALSVILTEWGWHGSVGEFLHEWFTVGTVPDPAALELVSALRRHGTSCALASNQDLARAGFMDDVLGYRSRFDQRFYSCALGYAKPDPDYFRTILDALAAEPQRVLFVDDQPDNVSAARECGMRAEVLSPPGRLVDLLSAYGLAAVEAS